MQLKTFFSKKALVMLLTGLSLALSGISANAQTYRYIKGWSKEVNDRIESFLNSTIVIKERKVAAFDCDGTLFGQVPFYLADEALYMYAKEKYQGRNDKVSKEKMEIVKKMVPEDNTSVPYVRNRVNFFAGITTSELLRIGNECFHEKYPAKFYPEMRQLLANLKEYGFEVWVISASPELLYQQFVHEQTGIPVERILGVKSVIKNDIVTNEIILPVPQDQGKADVIQTIIKTHPLIVGGNSRGDIEMLNESAGLKIVVNPDDEKVIKGPDAGPMEGYTVKGYWNKEGALIVPCNDVPEGNHDYASKEMGIRTNKINKKE